MKIPQICLTKKFKIGVVIGLGVAVGLTLAGYIFSKCRERKIATCEIDECDCEEDDV